MATEKEKAFFLKERRDFRLLNYCYSTKYISLICILASRGDLQDRKNITLEGKGKKKKFTKLKKKINGAF